jgi:hypothetical protein
MSVATEDDYREGFAEGESVQVCAACAEGAEPSVALQQQHGEADNISMRSSSVNSNTPYADNLPPCRCSCACGPSTQQNLQKVGVGNGQLTVAD